jgi:tetratricopeptide (TPR) repeat protein
MALFLSPQMVPADTELGIYYLGLGRQEKAWDIFHEIAQNNPGAIRARQYLVKISYENSWYAPMREYLSQLEKLNPEYYYLYLDEGLLAEHRGSLAEEESAYREVLKLDFSSPERGKLSQILADAGRLSEAVELIEEGISLFPYDLERRIALVKIYEGAEMHAEAESAATEILSISPDCWEALTWRGFARERRGETESALADFRRVVELKHSYPWLSQYIEYLTPQEQDYYTPHRLLLDDILNANTDFSSYAGEIAVYLLDQKVCRVLPNGSASYTVHKIIKLLSDEAVPSFTTMSIDYSPNDEEVKIRSARVILPNGEELNATQIEDVSLSSEEARLYYDILSKNVTMPGLRSGAVIDFEYSVESKGKNIFADYFGEQFYFGNYHPTALSEYVLILPPQRKFYFHYVNKETPAEVLTTPEAVTYIYKWENLPGIVVEPSMPALANILPILQVSTFSSWEELGSWYWNLIQDQFVASDRIKQKVSQLTANKTTQMDKVKALYDFVVSQIRYVGLEFGIGGYLPHKAEDVLLASYGDCKDKGTLLITMLREIGVEADVVLVRTRDLGELDFAQPMLGLFNHFIVLAHTSEGDIFLDGTAEYHAYDQLPFDDQGVKVFVISSSGSRFVTTPLSPAEDNFINVDMQLQVGADGSANGARHLAYGDYFAPGQRSKYLNPARRMDQLAEYWNGIYGGTVVSDAQFSNLAVLEEPVVFSYNLSIPRLVRREGDIYYLPSRIPVDSLVSSLASNSLREYPLELNAPYTVHSAIEYQLPTNAQWGANLPQDFTLQNDFGSFSVKYHYSSFAVQVEMNLEINTYRVDPTDYARFRAFLAECDRREELEIPYLLAK